MVDQCRGLKRVTVVGLPLKVKDGDYRGVIEIDEFRRRLGGQGKTVVLTPYQNDAVHRFLAVRRKYDVPAASGITTDDGSRRADVVPHRLQDGLRLLQPDSEIVVATRGLSDPSLELLTTWSRDNGARLTFSDLGNPLGELKFYNERLLKAAQKCDRLVIDGRGRGDPIRLVQAARSANSQIEVAVLLASGVLGYSQGNWFHESGYRNAGPWTADGFTGALAFASGRRADWASVIELSLMVSVTSNNQTENNRKKLTATQIPVERVAWEKPPTRRSATSWAEWTASLLTFVRAMMGP